MEPETASLVVDYHDQCCSSFARLIRATKHPLRDFGGQVTPVTAQDEFDRYKVWAGSVGAGHRGSRYRLSLDYRLSEASFKSQVIVFLRNLIHNVSQVEQLLLSERAPAEEVAAQVHASEERSASPLLDEAYDDEFEDSPWEISDSEDGEPPGNRGPKMFQPINRRMDPISSAESGAHRQASSEEEVSGVRKPVMEMPHLLNEIKFSITCLYRLPLRNPASIDGLNTRALLDISLYQQFDQLYVKDKFPLAEDGLRTRLGKLISRRRQLLAFRESRDRALKTDDIQSPPLSQDISAAVEAFSGQEESDKQSLRHEIRPSAPLTIPSQRAGSQRTGLTFATRVAKSVTLDVPVLSEYAPSTPSYYTSKVRVEVPKRPRGADGQELEYFKCPYCFLACHVSTSDSWKKHVLRDLQPYVCTFGGCELSEHMFGKREEWYQHEMQVHRIEWYCNEIGHQPFNDRALFLVHMSIVHGIAINSKQEDHFTSMFQRPLQYQTSNCSLCLRDTSDPKTHVSHHMEQMALFALPRENDMFEMDSGANLQGSAVEKSDQSSFETSDDDSKSGLGEVVAEDDESAGPERMDPVEQVTVPEMEAENDASPWVAVYAATKSQGIYKEDRAHLSGFAVDRSDVDVKVSSEEEPLGESDTRANVDLVEMTQDVGIADWMDSLPDQAAEYRYSLSKRHEGTCRWLFETEEFRSWLGKPTGVLFCPGKAGVGKTIMAASVINHLRAVYEDEKTVAIAYVFCSHENRDEQTVEHILGLLFSQLLKHRRAQTAKVFEYFALHLEGDKLPSADKLRNGMAAILRNFSATFIIIDGLDECMDRTRIQLQDHLILLASEARVQLLMTSLPPPDVVFKFTSSDTVEIVARFADVLSYLQYRLREQEYSALSTALRSLIVESVASAAASIFLLAPLHLAYLGNSPEEDTIQELKELPNDLQSAYRRLFAPLEWQRPDEHPYARRVWNLMTTAKRQLSMRELQEAASVEIYLDSLHEESIPSVKALVSLCDGLITVDREASKFRLIHDTLLSYLSSNKAVFWMQSYLEWTCLSYLKLDDFASGACTSGNELEARLKSHRFLAYAAEFWNEHVQSGPEVTSVDVALDFLKNTNKVQCCVQVYFGLGALSSLPQSFDEYFSNRHQGWEGLHLVAYLGNTLLAKALLESGVLIDQVNSRGETPLILAVKRGEFNTARLLVNNAADLDFKDLDERNVISWAAGNGHTDIVTLLLDRLAKSDYPDKLGRTPLSWASANGHMENVKLLLDYPTNSDHPDKLGRTPLSWACRNGHTEIVNLLLSHGASPNLKDNINRTPLSSASRNGYTEIVNLLLSHEASPDHEDNIHRTPLSWASGNGHATIVELLLSHGASPDRKDYIHRTPLSWAAEKGHIAASILLLQSGVNVDSEDQFRRTPLIWATEEGHEAAVKIFIEHGADVNHKSDFGQTALGHAATAGNEEITKILLENGATACYEDNGGRTPLSWAVAKGHTNVAKLLSERGG